LTVFESAGNEAPDADYRDTAPSFAPIPRAKYSIAGYEANMNFLAFVSGKSMHFVSKNYLPGCS
jgi:hypothetical protein